MFVYRIAVGYMNQSRKEKHHCRVAIFVPAGATDKLPDKVTI